MSEMVKKWKIALFLNNGTPGAPDWVRVKKSTAFDLTLNADVQEFDYIADESPTKELMKYAPALSQSLTMYKGEPDYAMIFNKFYELKTGSAAKTEVLLVFFQEETATNTFKAWKSECSIVCNDLNSVDSTLTFDINFAGTVDKGTALVTGGVPVFSSSAETGFLLTITATGADKIVCDGVEKDADAEGKATFNVIDGKKYVIGAYSDDEEGSDVITADADTPTATITIA